MSPDPPPLQVMQVHQLVKSLPEVPVLHWFFPSRLPAVSFPAVNPFCNAVLHILGISGDNPVYPAFKCLKRPYDGKDFHAVVGGMSAPALQSLLRAVAAQYRAPSSRPGVSGACPVRIDIYFILFFLHQEIQRIPVCICTIPMVRG